MAPDVLLAKRGQPAIGQTICVAADYLGKELNRTG